jgi:hypothetical protein
MNIVGWPNMTITPSGAGSNPGGTHSLHSFDRLPIIKVSPSARDCFDAQEVP